MLLHPAHVRPTNVAPSRKECLSMAVEPPKELRVTNDRRTLVLVMPDGSGTELPAEMLRVMSPSAEVQGHSPDERKIIGGKIAVAIRDIQPIGHYAIRIVFDDGHDTGIFTWSYLRDLGQEKETRWSTYLDELRSNGLRRER